MTQIPNYKFRIEIMVGKQTMSFPANVPRTQVQFNARNGRPERVKKEYAEAFVRKLLHAKGFSDAYFVIVASTPMQ